MIKIKRNVWNENELFGRQTKQEEVIMKPLEAVSVLDLTEGNPYIGSVFADYGVKKKIS